MLFSKKTRKGRTEAGMDLLDILLDFWGDFPGGSKMAVFGLSKAVLVGFGVPGLCSSSGRLQIKERE